MMVTLFPRDSLSRLFTFQWFVTHGKKVSTKYACSDISKMGDRSAINKGHSGVRVSVRVDINVSRSMQVKIRVTVKLAPRRPSLSYTCTGYYGSDCDVDGPSAKLHQ